MNTDFDPENDAEASEDPDEDVASVNSDDGREHYLDVGYVFWRHSIGTSGI